MLTTLSPGAVIQLAPSCDWHSSNGTSQATWISSASTPAIRVRGSGRMRTMIVSKLI